MHMQATTEVLGMEEASPSALVSAITALARARTLEDVTSIVRRAARRLVGADGVSFVLKEDGHCNYVDEDAIGPLWKGQRFPLKQCMTGWVMLHREAVIIEDIRLDDRIPQAAYAPTFVRSMAAVPIRAADPIGAIAAYWARCRVATSEEVQTLQTFAEAASVAMENVRLLNELRRAKDHAESTAAENRILFEQAAHELVERERLERDRLLGQEDLSIALAAGDMGSWEWNLQTNELRRSPGIQRLLGDFEASGSVSGVDWVLHRTHHEDRPKLRETIERARREHDLFDCEFRFEHATGGMRWLRATVRCFFDEAGRPIRMYGVFRDTTDYRDVERRLKESERKLRLIFEQVPVGITLADEKGALLEANPAAKRMLESALTEIDHGLKLFQRRLEAPVHTPGSQPWEPAEFAFARRDGTTGWCRVRSALIPGEGGRPTLGMMEDITQQRLLEQGLVQAQKMESIARLAGGVAHDFNNALTVILGWLGVLEDSERNFDAASRQGLEAIRQASDHAASLTRQLLAFARRQVLEHKVVDLNALVGGVQRLVDGLVGEDVNVVVKLASQPRHAKVDPGQIEQVILNLAANARDAMPKGGKITLRTSSVEIAEGAARGDLKPGSYAVIECSDTGSGISPATLPFIFEPFFTTKEPGKGTGLGLATVHGIIRQHGGTIEVETGRDSGTTFRIYLPAIRHEGTSTSAQKNKVLPPGGKETILLVEDEPLVRSVAAMSLKLAGYDLIEVEGPLDAIKAASDPARRIDLLLSDVVMPEMNGVTLAEKLRELRPAMRVLLSSGYSEESLDSRAIDAVRVTFLPKPYTPDTLRRKVREVLDQAAVSAGG